jgi:DNA polymerase-3 subunit delta'
MNFLDFKDNEELKKRLHMAEKKGSLSHAYIIWGPRDSGKEQLCEALSGAIVCSGIGERPCLSCRDCVKFQKHIHPDIIRIKKEKDKREIYVSQIRDVVRDAAILPNEAAKKVFIVEDADEMNAFAQNAFLKLLEEPPSHAAFILLGTNPGGFLQTIRSRCIELQTVCVSSHIDPDSVSHQELASSVLSAFRAGEKLTLLSLTTKVEKLERAQISDFLDALYLVSADTIKNEPGAVDRGRMYQLLELLQRLQSMVRFNVGSGHIAGLLAAKLNGY